MGSVAVHAAAPVVGGDVDARIRQAKEALAGLTQPVLKDMLRRNDQAFSGLTSKELVEKIADQQVRGRIPRCPQCFGGKLRFQGGRYVCPGYADDDGHYHRCSFKAAEGAVKREAWLN